MNSRVLLAIAALAVLAFVLLRKRATAGAPVAASYSPPVYNAPPIGPIGAPPAALSTSTAAQPESSSQRAANLLANKKGTDLICKGVSTYYTGGTANGACKGVAEFANKVTQVQVKATVAVAKGVGNGVVTGAKAVGGATSKVGHAIASIF